MQEYEYLADRWPNPDNEPGSNGANSDSTVNARIVIIRDAFPTPQSIPIVDRTSLP